MGARLSFDTRICIVGAGPAGITAALEYQRLGYRHVTVLERAARVGGRCQTTERGNDLGAVAWVPWYFDEVTALSDQLGLARDWVPFPARYRVATGRAHWPFPPAQLARATLESARYLARWPAWQGVRGPGIGHVSPALTAPYRDFVRDHGCRAIAETTRSQTSGYGYRWDAPALYNVRYIPPRAMLGVAWSLARPRWLGGGTGLGFWKDGTQAIWERAVARHRLDVRTGVEISAIDRSGARGDAVIVHRAGGEPVRADCLILACNPRGLLGVLDASADERRLFGRIRTVDYRTYECTVRGLGDGRRHYGWFDENLRAEALNRPQVFFKRDAARADVVFYVSADGASDDTVAANIGDDLRRIGARLEAVTAAARFEYAPHVDGAALGDDFYVELDRLQGQRATLGIGATYTFDIMAHVMPQARDIVRRHVAGDLAVVAAEPARRAG